MIIQVNIRPNGRMGLLADIRERLGSFAALLINSCPSATDPISGIRSANLDHVIAISCCRIIGYHAGYGSAESVKRSMSIAPPRPAGL